MPGRRERVSSAVSLSVGECDADMLVLLGERFCRGRGLEGRRRFDVGAK